MKPVRNVMLTFCLALVVLSAVIYTACNKNKCDKVVCINNGVCYGGSCVCPVGFEGTSCQTLSRQKFIFTYNGGDTCGSSGYEGIPGYVCYRTSYDSLTMIMRHILNNTWMIVRVCTIQSTDSFTFIGINNSTSYYGSGKLSNDSLWMYYRVTQDTTSYTCTYFGQSLR